jgi:hypothetical protein
MRFSGDEVPRAEVPAATSDAAFITEEPTEGDINAWRSIVVVVFAADLVADNDRQPGCIVPQ